MVFLVPDEQDETLEIPQNGEDSSSPSGLKAQLDDAETSRATQKVDLDLDDAPFLEEEEEEEEEILVEAPPPPLEEPSDKEKPVPFWKQKKFVILGAGSVFFLILLLAYFLWFAKKEPEPPTQPETSATEQPVEEKPAQAVVPEEVAPPGESLVRLDPFIIEQRDVEGELRFLEISVVFATPEIRLAENLTRETPTVRYALYYYIKNKDLQFLTDEDNTDQLKKELLSVVNQYMTAGQFETILFEKYLVR
ncbi:MAG: flagellar basal body-associated FliL family protein [Desulfovibrionaceae bacterium]